MGEMLRRTAVSTNVKERLDFSCAILDADGELVVNAPHIPVHLGAMGLCVRKLRQELKIAPGDVAVTNHPAFGGSHLPDITVVTPVFTTQNQLLGYVANRAHHAEIGGIRPGSMPPRARSLSEEGVVIPPVHLVKNGRADWALMRSILKGGPYPTRALEDNLADLRAAVAANHRGSQALGELAESFGADVVSHFMLQLKKLAENKIKRALSNLQGGLYQAKGKLDDGSSVCVQFKITGASAEVDFTGSANVHPGNLNATPAIVRSAVIYVLRLLINEPLPLNEGLMQPIKLIIPTGMLNPEFPEEADKAPAVVGGNVETSQCLVNTMLKALKFLAGSQGTMNNLLFGTDEFGYYETVCGGCGAGPNFHGASAVHSHMTNTRITDVEVVEHRYPVRVERFAIRKDSGGSGNFRGGDGVIREFTFLKQMELSILSQNRSQAPFALAGGEAGSPGRQRLIRASGEIIELQAMDGCTVYPGDRLILETPGGGGFGKKE